MRDITLRHVPNPKSLRMRATDCADELAPNPFFRFADKTEIEAEQEQNEMNYGPLATDLRCLDRNCANVWQHNRKRYVGHP
jgi:hypothetical protein